jgi:hypothetical protein
MKLKIEFEVDIDTMHDDLDRSLTPYGMATKIEDIISDINWIDNVSTFDVEVVEE